MKNVNLSQLSKEMKFVLECIENIDNIYYPERVTILNNGVLIPTDQFRTNEDTYVAHLAIKIKEKFQENKIHIDSHYQINIPKELIISDNNYEKYNTSYQQIFDGITDNEMRKIPDIVIHKGPEDVTPDNQIFISEVKTSLNLSQNLFNKDLFKLNVYHEELGFKNTAFIIINSQIDVVRRMYDTYVRNGFYMSQKNSIYIIIKSSFQEESKIFEFTNEQ